MVSFAPQMLLGNLHLWFHLTESNRGHPFRDQSHEFRDSFRNPLTRNIWSECLCFEAERARSADTVRALHIHASPLLRTPAPVSFDSRPVFCGRTNVSNT